MSASPYTAFLPLGRRSAAALEPEETWWHWQGHDVHIARARRADASARVLVVHGAGGHSGALWPMAALLAERGLDVAAVDLPLYGRTTSPEPGAVRYDDWVRLLLDLVDAEHDGRPLILLGASIGGMLAYEVAARSSHVATVAATCLLDPRDWRARAHMTRFGPVGILGGLLSTLARGRVATAMIPMNRVANLSKMSRNPALSELCATDPLGGGARVPIGFLASYMKYRHASPESMRTPVVLLHPSLDAWTPVELSMRVFRRLASPGKVVMLRECGHFPVEEPGITDLVSAVLEIAER
ncbi:MULTISPECIES: alpha/beta hydrolase [unclassified Microbacterium]|uniref:alpha/beta hydrolase n=1 Tax=unclassified Microbacterium TaxID=2609290 RepID=UPI000EA93C08|nr:MULTISPECIES: alpha/beta hydrolase [unclassified Microbacterium]MBT2486381.1 alpha/beta hydrolase [Microbacterium sp. ISL-108]RKN69087.1 alpha/beta hydrolase [Microbacterium sp. CGR2]